MPPVRTVCIAPDADFALAPAVIRSEFTPSVEAMGAKGLSPEPIPEEVDNRIGHFSHQPAVLIRDSAFGILPGVARDNHVSGAVFKGFIYLFRDSLANTADVQKTLLHELVHYGIRRFQKLSVSPS